ncbi:MAG: M48 family metallopeptidase [Granulosicoccus sp.]
MQYENRQPEEGINVTQVHPLKQFGQLLVGALVMVAALVALLQISGGWLAKRIPFSFELTVMQELDVELGSNADYPQMAEYLNDLSGRVAAHMDLPEGMQITVHYNPQNVFNAFATVGGNLMFYQGLLEDMPDENTLAMVMAHEIAHVLHRDPVASLGGGVASTLAILALTGGFGPDLAGSVLGSAGVITGMQFSRGMEEASDESALAALNDMYGHVNGATALFGMFSGARDSTTNTPEALERFLSTHPRDQDRIDEVIRRADSEGWSLQGDLTPLPDGFKNWL